MIKKAKPYTVQGEAMDQKMQNLYASVLLVAGMDMRPLEPVLQRFVDRCESCWPVSTKRLRLQAEDRASRFLQWRGKVYRTVIDMERGYKHGRGLNRVIDACLRIESEVANG